MTMNDFDLNRKYLEAESLLNQNRLGEARSVIEYIEARQKIAQHNSAKKRLQVSIMIVLSSIILVSIGMSMRIQTTEINMMLKTNGMRINYMDGMDDYTLSGNITGQNPSIDNVVYFNSASLSTYKNFPQLTDKPLAGDISLQAGNAEITDLAFNVEGMAPGLVLDNRNNNFIMYVLNASITGKLIPQNLKAINVKADNGQDSSKRFAANEASPAYYFQTGGAAQQPVPESITVSHQYDVDIVLNNIQSITFSREDLANQGVLEPTILEGSILLADIGKELTINKDEFITLECNDCNQISVKYTDNYLTMHIKGKVKKITAGYRDNINDLMPTILEYLYKNQKLAMIWGAIIFLSGFIWNMRRFIN